MLYQENKAKVKRSTGCNPECLSQHAHHIRGAAQLSTLRQEAGNSDDGSTEEKVSAHTGFIPHAMVSTADMPPFDYAIGPG